MGCAPPLQPPEVKDRRNIDLFDCFTEVLRIDLGEHDLAAFTPSRMGIKGVFGKDDSRNVLYDFGLKECVVYDRQHNKVERIFSIPQHVGWDVPRLLEVISLDSILSFDKDHQSLIVCNTDSVLRTVKLNLEKGHHHPYLIIQPMFYFLSSIDGYIGFNTWIHYGEGGVDVDYDALMDDRYMACFFKLHGDSMISRDVPVKPFLRRTTFPDIMYMDQPFVEVNSERREVLIFHVTSDTVMTFGWDSGQIRKHVITGSEVELVPAKVPRRGSGADVHAMYENQERGYHRMYFDEESGMYLRELVKMFPVQGTQGLPPRSDIRLLQVVNADFEVVAEMNMPEDFKLAKRVGKSIYLQKSDDQQMQLVLYKFKWEKQMS